MIMPGMEGRQVDGMGRYGAPKKSRVDFTPPKDLELDGDSGESLVRWRKLPDGKVCIVSMDGVSLSGDEPDANDPAEGTQADNEEDAAAGQVA